MTDKDLYKTPAEFIKEIAKVLLAAFIIMMVIRTFIIEPFYIPSGSMLNTLQQREWPNSGSAINHCHRHRGTAPG